ncbi:MULTISPECIES: hypothetical protein [Clostridia]|uniref:hypothetical protein n=1 Tax=Clostridia TaxID=186801 RepID=UPI0013144EA6|nr:MULTISPECIES: hypothetical protein [Clostridia]
MENNFQKNEFVIEQVKANSQKMDGDIWYTRRNSDVVKAYLSSEVEMQNVEKSSKST